MMGGIPKSHGLLARLKPGVAAALFFLAGLLADRPAGSSAAPVAEPISQSIYVWQEQWSPAVGAALLRSREKTGAFYIYAGRIEAGLGGPTWIGNGVDWRALAPAQRPAVLVVRADDALIRRLPGETESTARLIAEKYLGFVEATRDQSCVIAGLQLDFDCPTRRLRDYRLLLEALKSRLGDAELSITALPTWMGSTEFGPLVRAATRFTLQVHGIERPTTIDQPIVLCDQDKIAGWLRRAETFKIPFDLALPTYGYRVVFDAQGKYAALVAEGGAALRPGYREQRVAADPAQMAAVVRRLGASRSGLLRSVIWFRLPVETDQLNWPWATLAATMDGREAYAVPVAELRTPLPGLIEIWLGNTGELASAQQLMLPVQTDKTNIVARDALNGFTFDSAGALRGNLPGPGESCLIAWLRMDPETPGQIQLGEFEWMP